MSKQNDNLVAKLPTGSRLYGTATEKSDFDFQEIYVPEMASFFGIGGEKKSKHSITADSAGTVDTTRHTLRDFIKLAAKGNPQQIEALFGVGDPMSLAQTSPIWRALTEGKYLFYSKEMVRPVLGIVGGLTNGVTYKVGRSPKELSHAYRVLSQLKELIMTSTIAYPLINSEKILQIKNGDFYSSELYDEITEMVDFIRTKESSLPDLDADKISTLSTMLHLWHYDLLKYA